MSKLTDSLVNGCQENDIFCILSQLVLAKHNEKRETEELQLLILQWAEAVNHAKESHHTCTKAQGLAWLRMPTSSVLKKEMEMKTLTIATPQGLQCDLYWMFLLGKEDSSNCPTGQHSIPAKS